MNSNAWSQVRINGQYIEEFAVWVGVHLFLAQYSSFWCWKHFCKRSAQVCHGSSSALMVWCSSWLKAGTAGKESKGLCVNMKTTKFLVYDVGLYCLLQCSWQQLQCTVQPVGPQELQWRNDRCMIRCIWGTKDRRELPLASLLIGGIDDIMSRPSQPAAQMVWTCTACHFLYWICHRFADSQHQRTRKA